MRSTISKACPAHLAAAPCSRPTARPALHAACKGEPGLCLPAASGAPPVWLSTDLGVADSGTVAYGQFTGAAMQTGQGFLPFKRPRYMIELLPFHPPGEEAGASAGAPVGVPSAAGYLYRVTAIGFGAQEDTQVVLQTYYRKQAGAGRSAMMARWLAWPAGWLHGCMLTYWPPSPLVDLSRADTRLAWRAGAAQSAAQSVVSPMPPPAPPMPATTMPRTPMPATSMRACATAIPTAAARASACRTGACPRAYFSASKMADARHGCGGDSFSGNFLNWAGDQPARYRALCLDGRRPRDR